MKNWSLIIESTLILIPLSAIILYTTLLSIFIGIPVSLAQFFGNSSFEGISILIATFGNFISIYTIVNLWRLALSSIKNQLFEELTSFFIFIIIASIIFLVLVFRLKLYFGLLILAPILLFSFHLIHIQKQIKSV